MSSRWDSLSCEKGKTGERKNNGSKRRNRTAGPAPSFKDGTHYPSQFLGRHQRLRRSSYGTSESRNGTENSTSMSVVERESLIKSLKSQLFHYQSGSNKYEKSVVIQSIKKLVQDTSVSRKAARDEQPTYSIILLTLICLLEIKEEKDVDYNDHDHDDYLHSLVAQSIERCLNNFINDEGGKHTHKMSLTKNQVMFGITTLSFHYNKSKSSILESNTASSILVSLALLVKSEVCQLPPEKTACGVTAGVFLPYLSSLNTQEQKLSTNDSSVGKITCIYDSLVALLQNPCHASAMLAPLVQDVSVISDYGMEEQTVNPLRIRLLSVILQNLEMLNKQKRTEEQICVCRALSTSINAIRKLKKGNSDKNYYTKVDFQIVKRLQKFILEVLIKDKTISRDATMASLHLLRTLIACYPNDDMIGMGWKLIIEGANYPTTVAFSRKPSKHVHGNDASYRERIKNRNTTRPYLPSMIMIDNNDIQLRLHYESAKFIALVADCLTDFILILPWNKWLKHSAFDQERKSYYTAKSPTARPINTSGLYKNVVDALEALIVIAKNAFDNCFDRIFLNSLGRLIKVLLMEIPYCDIKLVTSGKDLWETLFNAAFDSKKSASNKEKKKMSTEILVAAMGGKVTPQGELRGMCTPGRTWFLNEKTSSEVFIKRLLDSFETMDECLDWSVKMLSSILRTLPDVALQRWDSFHKLFEGLNTRSNSRMDLIRLEVLESLMLGRRDFTVSLELKPKNDRIIMDFNQIMLKSLSQNGVRRLVAIYSAFRSQDWNQLDSIDGRVLCHFGKMLEYCHDSNAKIREGASKAVGEFCTEYITPASFQADIHDESKRHHCILISGKVCITMLELCKDQNASVRSMSIFSLGNLASALKNSNQKYLLNTQRLHDISKVVLSSFNDKNDKVIKNAIRSIGHIGYLLAFCILEYPKNELSSSYGILVQVIKSLTLKLSNTLHVTLKQQTFALTWKERSAAKKHGWGACHSLGLVFEGLSAGIFEEKCNVLVSSCSEAIRYLIQCSKYHTNLNEKVVLASMAAICQLSNDLLTLNDYQTGYIGDALIASILILQNVNKAYNTTVSSKLAAQNEQFLRHLLDSASITDANNVLSDEQITSKIICTLYLWMVEQPLQARAFDIFAIAFQQPGKWSNVSFEQQFASRASRKYKQSRSMLHFISLSENSSVVEEVGDYADEL